MSKYYLHLVNGEKLKYQYEGSPEDFGNFINSLGKHGHLNVGKRKVLTSELLMAVPEEVQNLME